MDILGSFDNEDLTIQSKKIIADLISNNAAYVGNLSIVEIEKMENYIKQLGYDIRNQAYEYFVLLEEPAAKLDGQILKVNLENEFLENNKDKIPYLEYEKNKIIISFL